MQQLCADPVVILRSNLEPLSEKFNFATLFSARAVSRAWNEALGQQFSRMSRSRKKSEWLSHALVYAAGGHAELLFFAVCVKRVYWSMHWSSGRDRAQPHDYYYTCSKKDAEELLHCAAKNNQAACLRTLKGIDRHFENSATTIAATLGHAECLRILLEDCAATTGDFCAAAAEGHFECLSIFAGAFRKRGIRCDSKALTSAAARGRLDVMQYLIGLGCKWSQDACFSAAVNRHIPCLQYALSMGAPYENDLALALVNSKDMKVLECIPARLREVAFLQAAKIGRCDMLEYLSGDWSRKTERSASAAAASAGSLECLVHLRSRHCRWQAETATNAALGGHLDCLKYVHTWGCPWDATTTAAAAENGHLHCLQYARENGCPWDEDTTTFAIRQDQLSCLVYAVENGCPWHDLEIRARPERSVKYMKDVVKARNTQI